MKFMFEFITKTRLLPTQWSTSRRHIKFFHFSNSLEKTMEFLIFTHLSKERQFCFHIMLKDIDKRLKFRCSWKMVAFNLNEKLTFYTVLYWRHKDFRMIWNQDIDSYYLKPCLQHSRFSKWSIFRPIRWIRQIRQNHPCMNRIQLQPHTSTENILV